MTTMSSDRSRVCADLAGRVPVSTMTTMILDGSMDATTLAKGCRMSSGGPGGLGGGDRAEGRHDDRGGGEEAGSLTPRYALEPQDDPATRRASERAQPRAQRLVVTLADDRQPGRQVGWHHRRRRQQVLDP